VFVAPDVTVTAVKLSATLSPLHTQSVGAFEAIADGDGSAVTTVGVGAAVAEAAGVNEREAEDEAEADPVEEDHIVPERVTVPASVIDPVSDVDTVREAVDEVEADPNSERDSVGAAEAEATGVHERVGVRAGEADAESEAVGEMVGAQNAPLVNARPVTTRLYAAAPAQPPTPKKPDVAPPSAAWRSSAIDFDADTAAAPPLEPLLEKLSVFAAQS